LARTPLVHFIGFTERSRRISVICSVLSRGDEGSATEGRVGGGSADEVGGLGGLRRGDTGLVVWISVKELLAEADE